MKIKYPKAGEPFFGRDAQYRGKSPVYRDNDDGTIIDRATGLCWAKVDSGHLKAGEFARKIDSYLKKRRQSGQAIAGFA